MKYKPYSFSKIDCFLQCPYRFFLTYIASSDIPEEPSFYLEKGKLTHLLIEYILQDKMDDFVLPKYEVLKKKDRKEIYQNVLNFCSSRNFSSIKSNKEKSIETKFYLDEFMKPCNKKNAILKGQIDLHFIKEKQLWMYDWKTGGSSKEKLEKFPKKSDQLELYTLWGLQKFDIQEALVFFAFVDFNHYQSHYYFKNDILSIKEKYEQYIIEIESTKEFKRKETKLCEYCTLKEICRRNKSRGC